MRAEILSSLFRLQDSQAEEISYSSSPLLFPIKIFWVVLWSEHRESGAQPGQFVFSAQEEQRGKEKLLRTCPFPDLPLRAEEEGTRVSTSILSPVTFSMRLWGSGHK